METTIMGYIGIIVYYNGLYRDDRVIWVVVKIMVPFLGVP